MDRRQQRLCFPLPEFGPLGAVAGALAFAEASGLRCHIEELDAAGGRLDLLLESSA